MADASIPVDLLNPGQVFASLGFLEAADVLCGDAEGGFDWSNETDVRFRLRAAGDENPFGVVLGFLATAEIRSQAPAASRHSTEKWRIETELLAPNAPFPFPDPASPATLPAVLEGLDANGKLAGLTITHWGEAPRTGRDAVKFWGGMAGYPGAAIARDALDLVRGQCHDAASDPFNLRVAQSSSFRFDWRRDYIPLDIGFSLNNHQATITSSGFPLVEVLAALGLSNARPKKIDALSYRYSVIGENREGHDCMFPLTFLRAALGSGGSTFPLQTRTFHMKLGWPGRKGQSRVVTVVKEETIQ